jgi:hypothetical protein
MPAGYRRSHTRRRPRWLCNPVVGCVCSVADEDHAHVRRPRWPDWSRTVGHDENIEPKARRHTVDLLAYRARVTVDKNLSQLAARFLLNPRGGASGPRARPSPPISHSRSFDHRLLAGLPLTAIASAFRCPTSTTRRLPRITPYTPGSVAASYSAASSAGRP